jgi:hypothetical protein
MRGMRRFKIQNSKFKIKDISDEEKCLARVKSVVATSGDLARNAVLGFAQVERFLKTNPD